MLCGQAPAIERTVDARRVQRVAYGVPGVGATRTVANALLLPRCRVLSSMQAGRLLAWSLRSHNLQPTIPEGQPTNSTLNQSVICTPPVANPVTQCQSGQEGIALISQVSHRPFTALLASAKGFFCVEQAVPQHEGVLGAGRRAAQADDLEAPRSRSRLPGGFCFPQDPIQDSADERSLNPAARTNDGYRSGLFHDGLLAICMAAVGRRTARQSPEAHGMTV
jgi:hypothetical protein